MRTDSHILLGYDHAKKGMLCQDYMVAGNLPDDGGYAIVSDGCSTGRRTDVGARTVSLATETAIATHWSTTRKADADTAVPQATAAQAIAIAASHATQGTTQQDMLATCVYAYLSSRGGFVHVQGDGVVAWQTRAGVTEIRRFEWDTNTPFYPAYASDKYQSFIAHHGGNVDAERLGCESWTHTPSAKGDGFAAQQPVRYSLGQGIRGITLPFASLEDLRYVAVFTDGVTQVAGVDWRQAVLELLAFKSTAGVFAKRRLIRFVETAQKKGRGPLDDIGYAVICTER